jgi:hypothetical protein
MPLDRGPLWRGDHGFPIDSAAFGRDEGLPTTTLYGLSAKVNES